MAWGEAHKDRSQQRPALHVVGKARLLGGDLHRTVLRLQGGQETEINQWELDRSWRMNDLNRSFAGCWEGGAPDLMTPYELSDGASQDMHIKRAVLADCDDLVVHRVVWGQPAEIPELLLGDGQRRG